MRRATRGARVLVAAAIAAAACASPSPSPSPSATVGLGGPAASPSAAPASGAAGGASPSTRPTLKEFPVPAGSGPHDVAPAADGGVWFTAQRSGQLGWLDPRTGQTRMIQLGAGSAPHGVILGPDGAPWVTDSGLNAIVRVDPKTSEVTVIKLPGPSINLNTAVFDAVGTIWFTGQSGAIGCLDGLLGTDAASRCGVIPAPRGSGPYGITVQPGVLAGVDPRYPGVYYASLAGDHIARVSVVFDASPFRIGAEPIDPPTKGAGPRRVWSDSKGTIWVSEWNAGNVARYEPKTGQWREWKLPGARPQAYAVFVDDRDVVWLSEWSASAIVRFDPATETFDSFPHAPGGAVRQLNGRPGEVWGALSALDRLFVLITR